MRSKLELRAIQVQVIIITATIIVVLLSPASRVGQDGWLAKTQSAKTWSGSRCLGRCLPSFLPGMPLGRRHHHHRHHRHHEWSLKSTMIIIIWKWSPFTSNVQMFKCSQQQQCSRMSFTNQPWLNNAQRSKSVTEMETGEIQPSSSSIKMPHIPFQQISVSIFVLKIFDLDKLSFSVINS